MGVEDKIAEEVSWAVEGAERASGISKDLLIAVIKTESNFNKYAVSSKNYMGLMQIPHPLWDADSNVMVGSKILKDKLRITDGNLRHALCLYKGWRTHDRKGLQKADEVIRIYKTLA